MDAAKAMAIAEAEALAAAEAGEEPSEPRQERAIRTDLATLRRTATQLIEDMEELEAIVDTCAPRPLTFQAKRRFKEPLGGHWGAS